MAKVTVEECRTALKVLDKYRSQLIEEAKMISEKQKEFQKMGISDDVMKTEMSTRLYNVLKRYFIKKNINAPIYRHHLDEINIESLRYIQGCGTNTVKEFKNLCLGFGITKYHEDGKEVDNN